MGKRQRRKTYTKEFKLAELKHFSSFTGQANCMLVQIITDSKPRFL